MQRMLLNLNPPAALLLLPDDHLAVVRARREDVAELGVRPGNLPHRARVPLERVSGRRARLAVDDIEHFYRAVRGACREPLAVVVQLRIVL